MAKNEVQIKVATDVEMSKVQALEDTIRDLKRQQLQLKIEADTKQLDETKQKLEEAEAKLNGLLNVPAHLGIAIDDQQIDEAAAEVQSLKEQVIALEIAVNDDALEAAKSEVEELDGKEVNIDLQMPMQNFSQGLSQARQGLSELKQNMDEVAQSGMQSEQNKAFLEMNLGAEKAKQTYQDISDIVARMPGDDNTMRSVLSTAQALGNNLKPDEMEAATKTMADYMSGSATMGKMATESQQDIMKYLLDGNTAELERGSIVSSQVDKLKDANTFMERQAAMQEVLNELGYGGISTQDTMLNKQAEWEGMLYNSQDALSSMWLGAEKGAMDYILQLNDASNGIVGMGIVAGQMVAGPLVEMVGGLGQMATGMKALKDLNMIQYLKDLQITTKLSAAADWLLSGAQAVLNAIMSMNPIVLVVLALVALAAALVWAYYNVDWFREMVDNAWASLVEFANQLMGAVTSALDWVGSLFQNFTNQLGLNTNDWMQAILGFILFIPQLPAQLAIVLFDAIAQALGFGANFHQTMMTSAWNAVNGFIIYIATLPGRAYSYLANLLGRVVSWGGSVASNFLSAASRSVSNFMSYISTLPGRLASELQGMLSAVGQWAATLPQKFWEAGVNAVKNFLSALGIASPGTMQRMMVWEVSEMTRRVPLEGEKLVSSVSDLGADVVDSFKPTLSLDFDDTANASVVGTNESFNTGGAGNITLNIEIGSVDNEDRVNEIVDAVRKALAWNNKTAGRTV